MEGSDTAKGTPDIAETLLSFADDMSAKEGPEGDDANPYEMDEATAKVDEEQRLLAAYGDLEVAQILNALDPFWTRGIRKREE